MHKSARLFVATFSAIFSMLAFQPANAEVVSVETWIEQWDPVQQKWVRVADGADRLLPARGPERPKAIAQYGPFQVISEHEAALVGITGAHSPRQFAAMLRNHPHIRTLRLVDCPGTENDRGNFAVGRMIRAAGIATHVPAGGSVRSGAVELFLAGSNRRIDDGAEFAVHSWLDNFGREAQDFAPDAPQNRIYLDYYREMGMDDAQARAFYDMTNSVPHASAKWLTAQDMRGWIGQAGSAGGGNAETGSAATIAGSSPQIAYLDLPLILN